MIETQNLSKRFEKFTALNQVSCRIPRGSIYGMVGSNGAGKSTFLRLVTGVYSPDEGSITVEGKAIMDNPAVKSRMIFVPDDLYFLPGANMNRMAALYASSYPRFDRKRFEKLSSHFKLDPKKPIRGFSKGMKRQAATIMALACRPDYYFFDETFDGLDPVIRSLVKGLICEEVTERNVTAIITSHSLRELEDTCDQLALLHEGGLLLQSDVQDLKTTLFKVQLAFERPYDRESFSDIEFLHFEKSGSVSHLIIRGDREETLARLKAMEPMLLNLVPLSLEEVFTYEMKQLGYSFDDIFEKEETQA